MSQTGTLNLIYVSGRNTLLLLILSISVGVISHMVASQQQLSHVTDFLHSILLTAENPI